VPALIVVVNADPRNLRLTEEMLSAAGYLVAAAASYGEAKQLMDSVTPDLLVTDVRLEVFNGLQLAIRSRFEHPNVPVIVTHARADKVLESEARRYGAEFVSGHLENPDFLRIIHQALAERRRSEAPTRRWSRRPVSGTVEVNAADAIARVVDMSYGGVKLAFLDQRNIPSRFEIRLPASGATVKAHRVWTASTTDHHLCGAALDGDPTPHWRAFVDSVTGSEQRPR
jgi:two-component system, cell cycle response regulator DivK